MKVTETLEDRILDAFDDYDIELNYDNNGLFSFSSIESLDEAEDVLQSLDNVQYNRDDNDLTIQVLFEGLTPKIKENLLNKYFNKLKEDYNKNLLTKSEYESKLEDLEKELNEDTLEETYSEDELDDMIGKTCNLQKIQNIYRRTKYNDSRLFAHTRCTNCGREKKVFLSNLINDPDKYGSCVCSDTNIESRLDTINDLYTGTKKLSNNTSGYTGVSFVKNYKGELYNKWRAYIDVDGKRIYLGDFTSKNKAIKARKEAALKGVKWYKAHKNQFMKDARRKTKRYRSKRAI